MLQLGRPGTRTLANAKKATTRRAVRKTVRYPKAKEGEIVLGELNHTELISLARFNGIIDASRGTTMDDLRAALENLEPLEATNPYLPLRQRLYRWVRYHWPQFQMQAKALPGRMPTKDPHKEGDLVPEDMLHEEMVLDVEVVALWVKNKHQVTVR